MSSHQDIMKPDDVGISIVPVLACVLNQLCARNDRLPHKGVSKFHALRPPAIGIKDYLQRVLKYAACSGECFVLSLVYIDRIIQSNPTFVVNSLNIHRLLITSVMLAAKSYDDQYFNNAYYAKVGGIPCHEMNSLEVEFLFMTNFTLFVNTDTYTQYYTELCNHANNPNNNCQCSQQRVPQLIIPFVDNDGGINTSAYNQDLNAQPSQQYIQNNNNNISTVDQHSEVDSNTSSQHNTNELQQKLKNTELRQDRTPDSNNSQYSNVQQQQPTLHSHHGSSSNLSQAIQQQMQQQQQLSQPTYPCNLSHSTSNSMMTESPAIHNQRYGVPVPYDQSIQSQQQQQYVPVQSYYANQPSQQQLQPYNQYIPPPPQQQQQPYYAVNQPSSQQSTQQPINGNGAFKPPQQPVSQQYRHSHTQSQPFNNYQYQPVYQQQQQQQSDNYSNYDYDNNNQQRVQYNKNQYYNAHSNVQNIPNRHNDIRQNHDKSSPPVTSY